MPGRRLHLTEDEIRLMFADGIAARYRPILSPGEFAELLGVSRKTIYSWLAQGRMDGAFRKRGKHVFILRDRAIAVIFNGRNWSDE